MPRGRGRGRGRGRSRSRLSRMDAAVDAMLPLGFPEEKVKKHVKDLLEVYGGDEGWPFIEEFAYKVLLDSILEAKDDEEQVVQNGYLLEEKSCVDEEAEAEAGPPEMFPSDILESTGAAVAEPRPRHLPCYGWIDSDEDDLNDDDFINLTPMPTGTESKETLDVSKWTKNRRPSRWDLRPDDP